ncbi:MAG: DEAD/DEAH box helicase, partial [Microbacterium sp.]
VLAVDPERSAVREPWHVPESGRSAERREVALRGDVAPGSRLKRGSAFALYARPAPFAATVSSRWAHVAREVEIVEELDDGCVVAELARCDDPWDALPVALAPGAPPRAGRQQQAIDRWAESVLAAGGGFPEDPATDLLRRRPPRGLVVPGAGSDVDAIVESVLTLDRSYLAVQGPPGTGKTYVGSHVIARLVSERGYRIGVVAQSHAVVEHMLEKVIGAGLPADRVGKAVKDPDAEVAFTRLGSSNGLARFADDRPDGYVIGGTAWDFAHPQRVRPGQLDLLVVDEAGQFSLAPTIAVATAARNLLLLGDPQQLPQVSQGTHPEPIDSAALGWAMAGEAVLPPNRGYFLGQTWRMHPQVARVVSELSYEGHLAARPGAELRAIEGVEPGVHIRPVRHHGNATDSPEEAAEVVRIARDLVGRAFADIRISDDGRGTPVEPRPLEPRDLIVVAPYNAQVARVEEALAEAGLPEIRVGTVDRFQGQEAAVSIVTLAASSGADAPRGTEFLMLQNRLNVAVSRAQVAAYLVHSPALLDDLPHTPDGVARMSAFARLVGAADGSRQTVP